MKTLKDLLTSETINKKDLREVLETLPDDILKFDPSCHIAIIWSIEDIKAEANDYFDTNLTDDEAFGILCDLKDNHDSESGINFETIRNYIHYRES